MLVFVKRFIWNQEEGKLFYVWTKIMVKTIRNNWKKESTFSNALKKQSWLSLQFISKKNIATPVFFLPNKGFYQAKVLKHWCNISREGNAFCKAS